MTLDAAELPASSAEQETLARLCEREAALSPAALVLEIDELDADRRRAAVRFLAAVGGRRIVSTTDPLQTRGEPILRVDLEPLDTEEQLQLWTAALNGRGRGEDLAGVAQQFRLGSDGLAGGCGPGPCGRLRVGCLPGAGAAPARRSRSADRARGELGRPRAAAAAARDAAADRRPRPPARHGLRGLGLRRQGRARPRHQRAVRRAERHRQDDGRRGARRRAAARPLPHRPQPRWSASTSARPRRTCAASSTPPRRAARSCSSTRPTRCSASAARSRTATTATPTSRSATCCSAWRPTAAWRS